MSAELVPPGSAKKRSASFANWLSRYLRLLLNRWLEIVLITAGAVVLTAAGVLLYRQGTPPVYEASAMAAIVRTSSAVTFDERFTTTAEQPSPDGNSRRRALVALVKSGSIAQQVIDELGDALPVALRSPAKLLNRVRAQMATANGRAGPSDLIQIRVRASAPELAAEIANAWARVYVQQANSVYGQVPDEMLISVEAQLVEAQSAYSTAQAELEGFLVSSPLDALLRRSDVLSDTLGILQQGRVDALNNYMTSLVDSYGEIVETYAAAQAENQVLPFGKEQAGQRARVAALLDARNAAEVDTLTGQSDSLRRRLRMAYDQWLRTSSLLGAARTLQQQVGGSTGRAQLAANALALQVLNLQLVNAATGTPPSRSADYLTPGTQQSSSAQPQTLAQTQPQARARLQVQLDGSAAPASAAELQRQADAAVASLEAQLAGIEQNIAALSQAMLNGDSFEGLTTRVPADSPLTTAIAGALPALFQSGVLSATTGQPPGTDLAAARQAQAARFLALAENSSLPAAASSGAPLTAASAALETQLRTLRSQIEIERARKLQLIDQRNLAWGSVQALNNKQAELQLARAAANSEVRLFTLAVPLDEPLERLNLVTSLIFGAVAGLLLGVAIACYRALRELGPGLHR